jgi:hypothetical protein
MQPCEALLPHAITAAASLAAHVLSFLSIEFVLAPT